MGNSGDSRPFGGKSPILRIFPKAFFLSKISKAERGGKGEAKRENFALQIKSELKKSSVSPGKSQCRLNTLKLENLYWFILYKIEKLS